MSGISCRLINKFLDLSKNSLDGRSWYKSTYCFILSKKSTISTDLGKFFYFTHILQKDLK